MKQIQYRYEFEIDGEVFFLGIGESSTSKDGVVIKVHKIQSAFNGMMKHLFISFDGGKWYNLENGKRTANGKYIEEFKKYSINHCSAFPNGIKSKEIKLHEDLELYKG